LKSVLRPNTTSSGFRSMPSAHAAAAQSRLVWVSDTPFGFPIVPDV
jgi:hypothetical protein